MSLFQRAFFLLLLLIYGSGGVRAAEQPNVVMIISDDQGWTDFGFMGHGVIRTPHLDRLAAESAVFPNGYVPMALCRPSLATMVTGLYPHQHKITGNDPYAQAGQNSSTYAQLREQMISLIDRQPTLPKLLAERGYLSHQSGKWWEGSYKRGGFTHGMTRGFPEPGGRHGDDGLRIGREGMEPIFEFIDHAVAERKPFFVWYAPFLPHAPHNPPERILSRYRVEGRDPMLTAYFAMCEWLDETVGQLLGYLDEKKLAENTLVVFVVDNGWIQAPPGPRAVLDHLGWMRSMPVRGKLSPYDGGVRIPILLRWPGRVKHGRYYDLVSTIDLAPTILQACGVAPTPQMPGLNLLEVVSGKKARLDRDVVFGEHYLHDSIDLNNSALSLTHRWIRKGDWKLILPKSDRVPPELYNLALDPFEQHDLIGISLEQVQQAQGHLSALIEALDVWLPVKKP